MNNYDNYRHFPGIQSEEDLGIACIGSPHTAIKPPNRHIDRAEYGRRLADAEGGVFTPSGYFVPIKNMSRRDNYAE